MGFWKKRIYLLSNISQTDAWIGLDCFPSIMNTKCFRVCFVSLAFLITGDARAQSGDVVFQNNSSAPLKILRGQNPGRGNSVGHLAAGQSVSMQVAKGRIYSFMSGNKLVASYRGRAQSDQSFAITDAMVRKVDPSALTSGMRNSGNRNQANDKNKNKNRNRSGGGGATGSNVTAAESLQFLNVHNAARKQVGLQKVKWSPQLAAWAQQQAYRIARSGNIAHTANAPYGENLGVGTGAYGPVDAANGWIAEKQFFRRGDSPVISGNRVTGHYTQVVWRETSEIGAGKAIVQKGQWKGATIVVGAYNPRGNMNRRAPF